jgi:hypothetical protein
VKNPTIIALTAFVAVALQTWSQEPVANVPLVPPRIVLPTGTRLPLVMANAISTHSAKPGDPVYFETTFPVVQDGRIIIPAGSFVHGQVVQAKRAGRIKGRAELMVRMNELVFPNAYVVDLNAVPSGAASGEDDDVNNEGKLKGDTDRLNDAGTIIRSTGAGGGIGGLVGLAAGNAARGAAVGLAAGAAMGVLAVLLTRGPEVVLARGTSIDVQLDRPMSLDGSRINFTDPGRASTLAGPPDRRPARVHRFP